MQRRQSFRQEQNSAVENGLVQIPSGHILVCKVYLSKCVQDTKYPHFDYHSSPSQIWDNFPVEKSQQNMVQSVYRVKEGEPKQRLWFVFDNALVLPEYMVEFEYTQSSSLTEENRKTPSLKEIGAECNKLFEMVKNVQNVLDDTYIRHLKRN